MRKYVVILLGILFTVLPQDSPLALPLPPDTTNTTVHNEDIPPNPVPFLAVPPVQDVDVSQDAILTEILEANADYLLTSFDTNHILFPFRVRANISAPQGNRAQVGFWDTDLKGANAGRFLMGAGNTLRWLSNPKLKEMVDEVIDGVEECKDNSSGYILAYHPEGFMHSEQGDYGRSWFTQGLIEVGKAGSEKAWPLLRGLYDWFNNQSVNSYLPYLYDGISNGEQGQIASTRMYLETPVGKYMDSQIAQDTYRDDIWMRQLIARDPTGIAQYHMPSPNHPHCYEITSFLSMFDNYRATHNTTWLDAAQGAWDIVYENFIHVDGSSSLTEGAKTRDPSNGKPSDWPAKSYPIHPGAGTGETCCTSFWIKFCQRFQALDPLNETYAAQIEKAVYNAMLRQMVPRPPQSPPSSLPPGIRYHAVMEGVQEHPNNDNTCCEGQGTRIFGSLPEYIFSLSEKLIQVGSDAYAPDSIFVNMFFNATLYFNASSKLAPSALPVPPPLPPLPTPNPNLNYTWKQIAQDSFYKGVYCGAGLCPKNATSLQTCQAACIESQHPYMCMGITYAEPSPGRARCISNCAMRQLPMQTNTTGPVYTGVYNLSLASNVRTLADCRAACLADPSCVQITWSIRPQNPCVIYHEIDASMMTYPQSQGWVKCNSNATNATACAPFGNGGCVTYSAIDQTIEAAASPGSSQWLLVGREVPQQRDWIVPHKTTTPTLSSHVSDASLTQVSLTMQTAFPFSSPVSVKISWVASEVKNVYFTAHIRVPSWLMNDINVTIKSGNTTQTTVGRRGEYISLNRTWSNGDIVLFNLPQVFEFTKYTGIDQIKEFPGKRYALSVGPIVLACTGKLDTDSSISLPWQPESPQDWLIPIEGQPLHYTVKNVPDVEFQPLWHMDSQQQFTVFPVYTRA
eukprot:m.114286 g.114286  ORF g.114286 m.114286 type:complete len:908 (-) comp14159_c0_seq2:73-2796(-)